MEAVQLDRKRHLVMFLDDIAGCYLAIGDRERAEPFARQSLVGSGRSQA